MTSRQAKKIVNNQAIYCHDWSSGALIATGGRYSYPEARYRKALRIVLKKMDRELQLRKPGAIARLAALDAERTQARIEVLKARSARPKGGTP